MIGAATRLTASTTASPITRMRYLGGMVGGSLAEGHYTHQRPAQGRRALGNFGSFAISLRIRAVCPHATSTDIRRYLSFAARKALTLLMASARASGLLPTVGECPSGGSLTLVTTRSGRLG